MKIWYVANIQRYKLAQVHRLSEYCDNTLANTPNSEMVMHLLSNIHCTNSINSHVKLEVSNQYIIVEGCTIKACTLDITKRQSSIM